MSFATDKLSLDSFPPIMNLRIHCQRNVRHQPVWQLNALRNTVFAMKGWYLALAGATCCSLSLISSTFERGVQRGQRSWARAVKGPAKMKIL